MAHEVDADIPAYGEDDGDESAREVVTVPDLIPQEDEVEQLPL
jgi:hypothetical protein